jgi:hypothetical protein
MAVRWMYEGVCKHLPLKLVACIVERTSISKGSCSCFKQGECFRFCFRDFFSTTDCFFSFCFC